MTAPRPESGKVPIRRVELVLPDPFWADQFAAAAAELAANLGPNVVTTYAEAKSDFVNSVLQLAQEAG